MTTTILNDEQSLAVRSPLGPTLVPAAPGSGKTRVAAQRIVWLISELQADPASILAFTFTNRAARELRERIAALLTPAEADALFAGTFHSWGARFLKAHHRRAGLQPEFSIYDNDDSLDLIRTALRDLEVADNHPAADPRDLLRRISHLKSENRTPADDLRRWQGAMSQTRPPREAVAAHVHQRYQELLAQNNAVDFDDLITLPLRILLDNQDLRQQVHARVRHVIVDEYQDTSLSQHLLVATLVNHPQDPRPSIYAVGDPDQAIYSFRNADIDNIIQFRQIHYQNARERQLRTNHRSSPQIIRASQSLIEHNDRRIDRPSVPVQPPLDWIKANNPELEAKEIARQIQHLLETQQFALHECAVIYRTNPQSRSIEEALRAESIPYHVAGNYEFFARAEIKRYLDYLALALNPLDSTRLRRIANVPSRRLGPRALQDIELHSHEREIQLRNALTELVSMGDADDQPLSRAALQGAHSLDALLSDLAAMASDQVPVSQMIDHLSDQGGLREYFRKQPDGDSRVANIQELRQIADQQRVNLSQFLERTSIGQDQPDALPAQRVTLATIHQTKGLEFDVVYIAGAEEGLIPHRRSTHSYESLEEERRLMYVAMTRARRRLIISWCRFRANEKQEIRRSRFVGEIHPQAWSKPLPNTG